MEFRRSILMQALLATALLSACSSAIETASSPTQVPTPPPAAGTCNANQAQFAVGERASDNLLERSKTAAGASVARYLRPNQPVTLEYLATRLNLKLDEKDVVASVTCG